MMENRLRTLLILLSAGLSMGWADTMEDLRSAAVDIRTVSAEVIQEKHLKMLTTPLISRGSLKYRGPGSLRWEYLSPVRSILLMDRGRVVRYVAGESGWHKDDGSGLQAMQVVFQEISRWLAGRFGENPVFTAALASGRRILLTPKDAGFSRIIETIEITLSDTPGIIEAVRIQESPDAYTLLRFHNVTLNAPLPDSWFQGPE